MKTLAILLVVFCVAANAKPWINSRQHSANSDDNFQRSTSLPEEVAYYQRVFGQPHMLLINSNSKWSEETLGVLENIREVLQKMWLHQSQNFKSTNTV